MRISYLCYLMILIFCAGCTSTGTGRRVDGNEFYSSYPKMSVKISPDFRYIDKQKKEYAPNVLGGEETGEITHLKPTPGLIQNYYC